MYGKKRTNNWQAGETPFIPAVIHKWAQKFSHIASLKHSKSDQPLIKRSNLMIYVLSLPVTLDISDLMIATRDRLEALWALGSRKQFLKCAITPEVVKGFQSHLLSADEPSLLFLMEKDLTWKDKFPEWLWKSKTDSRICWVRLFAQCSSHWSLTEMPKGRSPVRARLGCTSKRWIWPLFTLTESDECLNLGRMNVDPSNR